MLQAVEQRVVAHSKLAETREVELNLDDGVKVNYLKLGAALKKIPGLEAKGED